MSTPLVSIVIPCYNHEDFVQDSIQSVIDQTYNNIELIIIDDGSKDNSISKIQEMIDSCEQRFVRFEFRSRPNKGLSATLNEAIEWCKGEYYSAIASDDIMLKDKTQIQVDFLEKNNDIAAVFGGIKLIDSNNLEVGNRLSKSELYNFEKIIMHKHNLPAPTQLIRLEAIRKVGGYNSNLFIEDWYMWLKISQDSGIFYLNQFFTLYRKHDDNMSKKLKKMQQGRLEVLSCFKDSIYYDKALKRAKWINSHEEFMMNRKPEIFLNLFCMNPKKTTLMSIIYFKKYFMKILN